MDEAAALEKARAYGTMPVFSTKDSSGISIGEVMFLIVLNGFMGNGETNPEPKEITAVVDKLLLWLTRKT